MQGRGSAETLLEARRGLRRQSDLRHQHQRLAALTQHFGNDSQVDLRLAAAGDAVQKVRGGTAEGCGDRLDGSSLGRRQLHAAVRPRRVVARCQHCLTSKTAAAQGHEMAPRQTQGLQLAIRRAAQLQQTLVRQPLPGRPLQRVSGRGVVIRLPSHLVDGCCRRAASGSGRQHGGRIRRRSDGDSRTPSRSPSRSSRTTESASRPAPPLSL